MSDEIDEARTLVVHLLDEDYRTRHGVPTPQALDRPATRVVEPATMARVAELPVAPTLPVALKGSNPSTCPELGEDEVEVRRRLDCPRYQTCLAYAAARRWLSFCCDSCGAYR